MIVAQELEKLFTSLSNDHAEVVVPERAFARLAYAELSLDQSEADQTVATPDDKATMNSVGLPDMLTPPATPPTPPDRQIDERMSDITTVDDKEMTTPVNESQSDFAYGQDVKEMQPTEIDQSNAIHLEDVSMGLHDMAEKGDSIETVNPADVMKPPPIPPRPTTESTKKRNFELFAEQNDVTEAISKVMDQLRWAIKADDNTEEGEQIDTISR